MLFTLGNSKKFHQSAYFTSSYLGLSVSVQFTCRITACFMSFMASREALHLWLTVFFTGTKLLLFIMFDSFSCISCDWIKLEIFFIGGACPSAPPKLACFSSKLLFKCSPLKKARHTERQTHTVRCNLTLLYSKTVNSYAWNRFDSNYLFRKSSAKYVRLLYPVFRYVLFRTAKLRQRSR